MEDSRTQRTKATPPPLSAGSLWSYGKVFQYRGKRVECRVVQDGRYWVTKGFLHNKPDEAMDRIEGKL